MVPGGYSVTDTVVTVGNMCGVATLSRLSQDTTKILKGNSASTYLLLEFLGRIF